MKFSAFVAAGVAASSLTWAGVADADPMLLIDPGLTGVADYDAWAAGTLTGAANPGYPTFFTSTNPWPAPIGSAAGGDATLNKTANGPGGGPYPATDTIYYGSFGGVTNTYGGTLEVADANPVADLENIAFQIQIGEAWTYDFHDHVLPELTYTTAAGDTVLTGASASVSGKLEQYYNGTVEMPSGDEDVYINTYLLQWDLSDGTEAITSFSIAWDGVEHAQLYALRLDQSDSYQDVDVSFVPEPGSLALLGLGVLLLAGGRRRGG